MSNVKAYLINAARNLLRWIRVPGNRPVAQFPFCTLLIALLVAAVWFLPGMQEWLEYDQRAVTQWQLWRLFTGHFVHYTIDHLGWSLGAFIVLGTLCECADRKQYLILLLLSAIGISVTLWAALPELSYYRGLSGLDSALFAVCCIKIIKERIRNHEWAWAALILLCGFGFIAKIVYEWLTQRMVFVTDHFIPVPQAHLTGAAIGLLFALVKPVFPGKIIIWNAIGRKSLLPLPREMKMPSQLQKPTEMSRPNK